MGALEEGPGQGKPVCRVRIVAVAFITFVGSMGAWERDVMCNDVCDTYSVDCDSAMLLLSCACAATERHATAKADRAALQGKHNSEPHHHGRAGGKGIRGGRGRGHPCGIHLGGVASNVLGAWSGARRGMAYSYASCRPLSARCACPSSK